MSYVLRVWKSIVFRFGRLGCCFGLLVSGVVGVFFIYFMFEVRGWLG